MNGQDVLIAIARDPQQDLPKRIEAVEQLALGTDPSLVPRLHELWHRPKPSGPKAVNWDPEAAERVVDLYIIYALVRSGDNSLLPQIPVLVSKAGNVLQGPDRELLNAARVVKAIGRPEVVHQLIELSANNQPRVVANAVRTLQLLDLPSPATGGPVTAFPDLNAPVSFTIHRLSEELNTIARVSNGRVRLSRGAEEQVTYHDYDRGEVRRQNTTLADILTLEIDMLDLTYAVMPGGVVICTFNEAAILWRKWWPEHSAALPR